MSNDSLSAQAQYLIDVDTKVSEGNVKRMFALMDGLEVLFGKASQAAKKAAEDFKLKGSDENLIKLQASVGQLGKSMRDLNTSGKNVSLLSDNEVTRVLALKSEVEKLEKALKQIAQNSSIKAGTLGLDSGDIQQKIKDLKTLEAAQRANALALTAASKSGVDDGARGIKQYQDRAALIEENIRLIKLQTQALKEAEAAKKGSQLNEDGERASQYKQLLASQAAARKVAQLAEDGERQYRYKQVLSEEKNQLLNQMEQRRQYLREKTLAENQQAKEYLSFQPNQALKQAFGNTNPEGAGSFQKINLPNSVPSEQIAAQKQVLALQEQLVERMRQGLPVDREHLALVEQVIQAKRAESLINATHLQQIRETEAGQRRIALASGVGAASLLAIQSAIRVNGLVLNGFQNAFSQSLSSAIAVEAEFKNVQAVTATTNTEMKGLEETIRKVAGSTKFSASEVAEAALSLGQAGLSARETAEAIPAVATLATAAGTSLAQAVSLTTSVLGIFDKQASETADIANKITQAANSSKVSVEKLAVGFQYAGNIAHQSGISFEEVTAAMSAMSNAGILNGSTLGSGLRSFLTEVQKPSSEFIASLTRIGLSLSDVDFKAHGLLNVTRTLREAGFVANDAIKSFDIRGAAAFNSLVANPDDLERQYKSLLDTSAAVNANAIQMDSLQAQSKRLQTSLENLTGVGFGPLGALLKDSANNLATLIQHASEASTTVAILGTALATVAAVGTARFAISLAAGALQLASFEAATVASVRALGTMTIAQSVSALYGVLGTAITSTIVAFQAFTFSSAGVITALRGVGAALAGISLLTGVGIAIAAITAGYYAITYSSESAKRAIDESTAAASAAKAVFDAKAKTIDNLDESIKSLEYRQNILKDGTAELRLATAEANNKFGDQITVLDVNNTSAATLINTLKKLRDEMTGLATLDLQNAVTKAQDLQKKTGQNATEKLQDLNGRSEAYPNSNILTSLARSQGGALRAAGINPDKLTSAAGALVSGDTKNQDIVSLQTLLPALLKNATIKLDPNERSSLSTLVDKLPAALVALSESRHADQGTQELQAVQTRRTAVAALRGQAAPGGGTIGDAIKTQPALIDKLREDNPNADSVEIFNLADAAIKELNAANKGLIDHIKKISPQGSTAAADVIQSIQASTGDLNRQRDIALKGSEALAKRRNTEQNGVYTQQLRELKSQPQTPARDAKIATLEGNNTARVLAYNTRGLTDPDQIAEAKEASDQAASARLAADLANKRKAPRSQTNAIEERAAKLQERSELAQAASDKSLAGMLDDFDAVENLLDSGKQHIINAGLAAQRGLKAQQGDKRKASKAAGEYDPDVEKTFAAESADLATTFQANLDSYVGQFSALKAAGGRKVNELQELVKKKTLDIANLKLDTDESLYQAGGRLREIQTQQATRQYPSAVGPNGTLEQEGNVEKLKVANLAIQLNADLLEKLGDANSGLIGDQTEILSRVTAQVAALKPRIDFLKSQLGSMKDGDPNRTAFQSELAVLSPQAALLGKEQQAADQTLKGYRSDKRTAQNQRQSLGIDAEEIKQKIPVEFTFENLTKTLENGVNEWRQAVGNLDSIKTLSDGMATQIGSYTASVATGFKSILDGTKSVKDGFKSMAASVLSTMLDLATQLLAQQAIKGIAGWLGSLAGGSTGGSNAGFGAGEMIATGGYINQKGGLERVQRFARGGSVTGGIAGRDSVPALLMPNEFVMNTKAVDAVGTDFLHSLNASNNSSANNGGSSRPKTAQGSVDNTVNVWVVSPDQQPAMGPKDVIAVIGDDIVRGGTTKKLIKSVQMGI